MQDPKEIANKLFDCAESVIQEWIADYFNVEIEEIFDNYDDIGSVIGFTHDDKQYNAYLVTMEPGNDRLVNLQLFNASENARKTCSMLYDGVYHVYSALAITAKEPYKSKLSGIVPKFDEERMSFQLFHINKKAAELQMANDQNNKIRNLLQSGAELDDSQKSAVLKSAEMVKEILVRNTREVLDTAEAECRELNKIPAKNMLYIVVEEASLDNINDRIEEGLSRMPDFGTRYRNPDETDFIAALQD
jgi:hypothetical protein